MAEAGAEPVKTFSIGFDGAGVRRAARTRGWWPRATGPTTTSSSSGRTRSTCFPELVWHYDEPFARLLRDPHLLRLPELARRHVTVALNGDGGDELLRRLRPLPGAAGDRRRYAGLAGPPRRPLAAALLGRCPRRGAGMACARRFLATLGEPPAAATEPGLAARSGRRTRALRRKSSVARRATATRSSTWRRRSAREAGRATWSTRALAADVETYLPDDLLVKVDIATMSHGLEGRSPFLDHRLMEFCAGLPSDLSFEGRTTKYLLKRAARDLLPAPVIDRPKQGFGVPIDRWLRGALRPMLHDVLLDARTLGRGYVRASPSCDASSTSTGAACGDGTPSSGVSSSWSSGTGCSWTGGPKRGRLSSRPPPGGPRRRRPDPRAPRRPRVRRLAGGRPRGHARVRARRPPGSGSWSRPGRTAGTAGPWRFSAASRSCSASCRRWPGPAGSGVGWRS